MKIMRKQKFILDNRTKLTFTRLGWYWSTSWPKKKHNSIWKIIKTIIYLENYLEILYN